MTLRGRGYVERSEALCRVLRSYRVLAGLTQAELAARLDIPQTAVSKIEVRERRLDIVEMEAYLRPLGRTVHDLLEDLDREVENTPKRRKTPGHGR
ncbi:helix-turn-helix domain-containing protein [Gordonia sp. NPDC003422]